MDPNIQVIDEAVSLNEVMKAAVCKVQGDRTLSAVGIDQRLIPRPSPLSFLRPPQSPRQAVQIGLRAVAGQPLGLSQFLPPFVIEMAYRKEPDEVINSMVDDSFDRHACEQRAADGAKP